MSALSRSALGVSLVALLASGASGGCGRGDTPPRTTETPADASGDAAATAVGEGGTTAADADAAPSELTSALPWFEAVRASRWEDASLAIASLPAGEQSRPEVRFARARIALARGKHGEVATLLEKLEDELPLLRDLIAKARAEAANVVGPFDKAGEWYQSRSHVSAWLVAADAWDRAGDGVKARVQADRVVAEAKRTRAQEERARALRMKIVRLKEGDPAAAADARWLAIHGLDEKVVAEANEIVDKQSPAKPLATDELLGRARVLVEAQRTDDALKMVERAGAKGTMTPLELCRARAEVLFKARTRYPEAAVAYKQCAAMGGAHAIEDAFLSARAWSRADRDVDAVPAFQALIQKHPKSREAEEAAFHLARGYVLAGKARDGAHALDEWVKKYPHGKDKKEAERYRALAHLIAKQDAKLARKLLEDQAGSAEDPIAAARWTNLAALAALRDGDRLHAISRWAEVARSRPLSWPALVARARLLANQASLPTTIEPTPSGTAEPLSVDLPAPADLLHRIGFDADAEDALREREAIVVGKAQGRGTEALCAAYALLDRGKRRYSHASAIPGVLLTTAPGPQNRWAWDCAFPRPYRGSVREHEATSKLPPNLVWSVMRQESAFDPEVVSPARAVGLMQLLPETARATAEKSHGQAPYEERWLTVPDRNIDLGALYLRELLDQFNGNVALAVGAYNGGPEAIQRWLSKAKDETLDIFVETVPFLETRGYIVRVLGNLARYGYLERGEAGVPSIALELK